MWGSAGHSAIAIDLEVKRKTGGQAVPEDALVQLFQDTFSTKFAEVKKKDEKEPLGKLKDEFMSKGTRLMHLYKNKGEPLLHPHPDKIEHKLTYPVTVALSDGKPETILVTNHVDLITIEPNIVDHKFKSRTPPTPRYAPLQLVSYGLAYEYNYGVAPKEIRRDDYIALKTKAQIIPQVITDEALTKQARTAVAMDVQQLLRSVKAGIWHLPERGAYPCLPEWCSYWNQCPYGGGGKTSKVGFALP